MCLWDTCVEQGMPTTRTCIFIESFGHPLTQGTADEEVWRWDENTFPLDEKYKSNICQDCYKSRKEDIKVVFISQEKL